MAVRLISLPATWARLRPASALACLTVPGLISTPRRRPRRPEGAFLISLGPSAADGCAYTSDITPAYLTICQLDNDELTTIPRLGLRTAASDRVSTHAHRQGEEHDGRQDGG